MGSSPRGRGKLHWSTRMRRTRRLIPAWAGKTCDRIFDDRAGLAHPRVGGENRVFRVTVIGLSGSSPRGRGKHPRRPRCRPRNRLIPAWAGKTPPTSATCTLTKAHPRVGGENRRCLTSRRIEWGSSPRGRGKQRGLDTNLGAHRLIPAWAGKTRATGARQTSATAHPRVGGENALSSTTPLTVLGSSPRGRGKRVLSAEVAADPRLIPAWAGKTIACA